MRRTSVGEQFAEGDSKKREDEPREGAGFNNNKEKTLRGSRAIFQDKTGAREMESKGAEASKGAGNHDVGKREEASKGAGKSDVGKREELLGAGCRETT